MGKQEKNNTFRGHMVLQEAVLIIAVVVIYIGISLLIDHSRSPGLLATTVLVLAAVKVLFFLSHTFRRIGGGIETCHSFNELLLVLALLSFTIVISFALDFACLAHAAPASFSGTQTTAAFWQQMFDFFYFSIVTFATIGYGDIVATTMAARALVILEIITSFIMIVFILSNFDRIKAIGK